MKKESCYFYASISKTFKTDGSIIIKNNNGLEEISLKEPVFIEFNEILVPFFMEHFEAKNPFTAVVKFESLHSEEQASEYIGKIIYRESTTMKNENSFAIEQILEFMGYDQNGKKIGFVSDYNLIPDNPILIFDQEGKEVMVPFHEELILEINQEEKKIILEIPEGLMDLYK